MPENDDNKNQKMINPVITIYAVVGENDPKFDKNAMDKAIKRIVAHYLPQGVVEIKYSEFSLSPPPPSPDGELH